MPQARIRAGVRAGLNDVITRAARRYSLGDPFKALHEHAAQNIPLSLDNDRTIGIRSRLAPLARKSVGETAGMTVIQRVNRSPPGVN